MALPPADVERLAARILAASSRPAHVVFSLPAGTSRDGYRARYRELAKALHPDKARSKSAEEAFKVVTEAFRAAKAAEEARAEQEYKQEMEFERIAREEAARRAEDKAVREAELAEKRAAFAAAEQERAAKQAADVKAGNTPDSTAVAIPEKFVARDRSGPPPECPWCFN